MSPALLWVTQWQGSLKLGDILQVQDLGCAGGSITAAKSPPNRCVSSLPSRHARLCLIWVPSLCRARDWGSDLNTANLGVPVVCLQLVRRWQCSCSIRRWWTNTRSSRRTRLLIRWKEECSSWPDCVILVSWPCSTLWKSPGDYHSFFFFFIEDENESEPKERVSTSEENIL